MAQQFHLADLFETVAATVPDRLATVSDSAQLTYAELDDRCGRLAAGLAAQGVRRGDIAGVQLAEIAVERSVVHTRLRRDDSTPPPRRAMPGKGRQGSTMAKSSLGCTSMPTSALIGAPSPSSRACFAATMASSGILRNRMPSSTGLGADRVGAPGNAWPASLTNTALE